MNIEYDNYKQLLWCRDIMNEKKREHAFQCFKLAWKMWKKENGYQDGQWPTATATNNAQLRHKLTTKVTILAKTRVAHKKIK